MTIKSKSFLKFDSNRVPSPCFVVDEVAVEKNLQKLALIQNQTNAKVLLALKAFSMFSLAPLVSRYLSGCCTSGLNEALLAKEFFPGEIHTFSAAFSEKDLTELLQFSDHIVFNSFAQWQRFQTQIVTSKKQRPDIKFGLRLNPMHSEGTTKIYDPCAPGSRLGIPADQFSQLNLNGISGIHFHTLCEQGFDALSRTLDVVEKRCAKQLRTLEWINLGGGHHITDEHYDLMGLIERIKHLEKRYELQVYLEPGEAIAIHTGILVCEVLDIMHNNVDLAILDTSATCHMPDILEMPYRAHIFNAGENKEKTYSYRLGGQTCLAGDVMGDYSFDHPLNVGQRLVFDDMSHYTMVKTTTFNGINLPSIAIWNSTTDELKVVREFGYEEFKSRLS